MKAGLSIIFSIFTIIGILVGVELETVILPDGNLLVKSPGWIFRLTVGVPIGLIPLLVYAIVNISRFKRKEGTNEVRKT